MEKSILDKMLKAIKRRRKELKISQAEVSQRTGLNQGRISEFERGNVNSRMGTFIEISRAVELEPVLVPRELLSSVMSIIDGKQQSDRPIYALDVEDEDD